MVLMSHDVHLVKIHLWHICIRYDAYVMYVMVSAGVPSSAMLIPSRSVECQRGIYAAGVDGVQRCNVI